jgi:protein-tyrosine phosphatase
MLDLLLKWFQPNNRQSIPKKYISSIKFYNVLCDLLSYNFIIDCRSIELYNISHIDLAIHIKDAYNEITKGKYDTILIYSNSSSEVISKEKDKENKLITNFIKLLKVHNKKNNLKQRILYLSDDYEHFRIKFSFLCSNHNNYIRGRIYPSQIYDRVYLSNYGVATSIDVLNILNITHVLNCTKDCRYYDELKEKENNIIQLDKDITLFDENDSNNNYESKDLLNKIDNHYDIKKLRIPIIDDQDEQIFNYFEISNNFINEAYKNKNNRILIHCKHGQSRSAIIAAAWLISLKLEISYNHTTAIEYLKECRPKVRPNKGFIKQLEDFHNKINK